MPEACFLCLDSTEFMRNGDQFPSRFLAVQEASSLLVNAKIQMNAENTVGFLTLGDNACTVFETLTLDVERVMCSLANVSIRGKECHFSQGLQIASLALSHRTNPRAEKRIVAFIGTPLTETDAELDKLARKLRKDDVAVDIVGVCVEGNVPRLTAFVEKLSKNGNSRFLNIPVGINLTDALMSSSIFLGEDSAGGAHESQEAYQGFGIDPSSDPELAMAIRMSLEEEQQRQAAVTTLANQAAAPAAEVTSARAPTQPEAPLDLENMSEEEMIARALKMSLEEAQRAAQGKEGSSTPAPTDEESFLLEVQKELDKKQKEDGKPSQPHESEDHCANEEEDGSSDKEQGKKK